MIDAAMITIYAYECHSDHERIRARARTQARAGGGPLAAVDVSLLPF
jgi:hypothetical protein